MNRRTLLHATTALGAATLTAGTATRADAAPSARPARNRPLRVHVVMFDGVEELDFAAPYEVFSASGHFADRDVDVRYVSLDGPRTVQAAYGTGLRVDHGWAPRDADLLVVPGGGYARRETPACGPRSGGVPCPGPWPPRPARA